MAEPLFYLFLEREKESEKEREREGDIDMLFHLFMPSLADSCRCPDCVSNLQLWHIRTTLCATELPGQG